MNQFSPFTCAATRIKEKAKDATHEKRSAHFNSGTTEEAKVKEPMQLRCARVKRITGDADAPFATSLRASIV